MGCSKIFALVLVAVATKGAEGQSTPSCVQKLVPCASYLNSTHPPPSCCDPLREAVTNEMTCLCNLFNTPGLLPSLGINITQALLLPAKCNIKGDLTSCVEAPAPTPTCTFTSTSSTDPPPGINFAATAGNDTSGVGRIVWPVMFTILLFWASMMLH